MGERRRRELTASQRGAHWRRWKDGQSLSEMPAHWGRRRGPLAAIRRVFAKFRGRYGTPRIQAELARGGVSVSRKRVGRLLRAAGLRAKGKRKDKPTTDSDHALPVAPNLLQRDFHTERPDAAWVSDIPVRSSNTSKCSTTTSGPTRSSATKRPTHLRIALKRRRLHSLIQLVQRIGATSSIRVTTSSVANLKLGGEGCGLAAIPSGQLRQTCPRRRPTKSVSRPSRAPRGQ